MNGPELRKLIDKSGLSVGQFAREIVIREPRTVYRWLSGESPIPRVVSHQLTPRSATLGTETTLTEGAK